MAHIYIDNGDVTFYPPAVLRGRYWWPLKFYFDKTFDEIPVGLLDEIYTAVGGGQYRLAAMGIRSLLEQVMIAKIGDRGSFSKNLDHFHELGYISLVQRDALTALLEARHAVTHRSFHPTERDLDTLLDIIERLLAAIYTHSDTAETLAKRVPPRGPPRVGTEKKSCFKPQVA
jgi:Domain of unknown function (DUF4145)